MAKKLWGTRFPKQTCAITAKFTSSISFDKRLARYDVLGSIAHAKMLGIQRIIPKKDAVMIAKGLKQILSEIDSHSFKFDSGAEDIHSNIQDRLKKKIGPAADKLHTGRSRNDQIALDVRMYLNEEIKQIVAQINLLQSAIVKFSCKNDDVIIPGYTHLQKAQCVLLAHHLLAYVEGLERDNQRLNDAAKRINCMPLGACAFSGTGLNIDRDYVRKELGFAVLTNNSIDSVSDRDFIIEALADMSILAVHLSRLAEDLIIWSTSEFNFIDIDFSFCTGSSIMPHKKNPDVLELIRGSSGKIHGDLSSVLILMKGLPMSYNRDLQLDKPPLFDAIDTIKDILEIFAGLFESIVIEKEAISAKLNDEALFSVDIVEYLIKKGVSYRQAHDIVGRLVRGCLDKGRKISELSLRELNHYSDKIGLDIRNILNPEASVNLKVSNASTNPRLVKKELALWKKKLNARI